MIEMIKEKFSEISSKCTKKYAKENGVNQKEMQLVFKLSSDGEEAEYLIYKTYRPLKELTFLEVLCVPIDLKGYSLFVPNFIKGALIRFSEENDIDKKNVRVMIVFDEKGQLFMFLYDGSKFIKQVELESLFDVRDLVTEQ